MFWPLNVQKSNNDMFPISCNFPTKQEVFGISNVKETKSENANDPLKMINHLLHHFSLDTIVLLEQKYYGAIYGCK